MQSTSKPSSSSTTAPAFEPGRPITALVVPVVAGSLQDRVVTLTGQLAMAWALPVRLVHVSASVGSADVDLEDVLNGMRSWYPDLHIEGKHLYGDDAAVAIADYAGAHVALVMSTEHIDAWKSEDSVAEGVIGRIGVPVILIGPKVTKAELRDRQLDGAVVVGLDGSASAEAGFGPAVAMAKALDQHLWLIRVVPEPGEGEPLHHPEVVRYLEGRVDEVSAEVPTLWEVIQSDDPVEAINAFAARREVSFIVASSGAMSPVEGHATISTTGGLAAIAQCPIVVVRAPEVASLESA